MAKNTLPVNFKDDIMNSAMGGKRRYKMINNSNGTISLEDVTTYDQVGSNFGASQLNATNQAVNAAADAGKIIDDLDAINNVTQEGYIAGARALKQVNDSLGEDVNGMTVHEKLDKLLEDVTSSIQIIYLGNKRNFNIASIVGEDNIGKYSANDFIVGWDWLTTEINSEKSLKLFSGSGFPQMAPYTVFKRSEHVLSYNNITGEATIVNGVVEFVGMDNYKNYYSKVNVPPKVWLLCKTPNPVLP